MERTCPQDPPTSVDEGDFPGLHGGSKQGYESRSLAGALVTCETVSRRFLRRVPR